MGISQLSSLEKVCVLSLQLSSVSLQCCGWRRCCWCTSVSHSFGQCCCLLTQKVEDIVINVQRYSLSWVELSWGMTHTQLFVNVSHPISCPLAPGTGYTPACLPSFASLEHSLQHAARWLFRPHPHHLDVCRLKLPWEIGRLLKPPAPVLKTHLWR